MYPSCVSDSYKNFLCLKNVSELSINFERTFRYKITLPFEPEFKVDVETSLTLFNILLWLMHLFNTHKLLQPFFLSANASKFTRAIRVPMCKYKRTWSRHFSRLEISQIVMSRDDSVLTGSHFEIRVREKSSSICCSSWNCGLSKMVESIFFYLHSLQ